MTFQITKDNTLQVLQGSKEQIQKGFNAIGATAVSHAQRGCPVDTGRLRNSISYITQTKQGGQNSATGAKAKTEDHAPRGIPEKNAVYIGTNVEYAAVQEYRDMAHRTGGAHFIKNAAANHSDEYKAIMEAALKS